MSSIGQTGINLIAYQGVLDQSSTQPSTQTSAPAAASANATGSQQVEGHGGHHHHHGGGMFGKIEQAVTSALQSAQANGSSSDPNQIIQDAISQVLQQGQGGTNSSASASASGDSTSPTSDSSSSFTQMLQSMGVDAQQFHSDFLAAVQAAQGGQSDPSSAFHSFPPGTTVDTTG